MKFENYGLVDEPYVDDFVLTVASRLQDGYKLVGGVCVVVIDKQTHYIQAVVKMSK